MDLISSPITNTEQTLLSRDQSALYTVVRQRLRIRILEVFVNAQTCEFVRFVLFLVSVKRTDQVIHHNGFLGYLFIR